jgi:hypothetical protein
MAQVHQFLTEVPRFLGFLKIRCQASAAAGLEKASTVWRQVATAGDPNRLLPGRLVRPVAQLYQLAVGSVVKWGWWR